MGVFVSTTPFQVKIFFEILKMRPKTSRTGRHSKRTGSSPDVPEEGNHYHTLRQEEKTSPRERSISKRRRTEESNQQSKITDFTGGGQYSDKQDREREGGEREKSEGGSVIIATLQRMEKNLEEDRRQNRNVSTQPEKIILEMFEIRKENTFLRKKRKS